MKEITNQDEISQTVSSTKPLSYPGSLAKKSTDSNGRKVSISDSVFMGKGGSSIICPVPRFSVPWFPKICVQTLFNFYL